MLKLDFACTLFFLQSLKVCSLRVAKEMFNANVWLPDDFKEKAAVIIRSQTDCTKVTCSVAWSPCIVRHAVPVPSPHRIV